MIAVVVSREDDASLGIRDALLDEADWHRHEPRGDWEREWTVVDGDEFVMVEKDGLHLYYDGVDEELRDAFGDVSLVVFVSRHSGETGPLLTAHHTGNFDGAEYGGKPRSLAEPAPDATKHLLRFFDRNAPEDFDVCMESTHHGPSELDVPSLFAEVGSGPDEWEREDAARTVARGVLSLPDRDVPRTTVVGVGGGHYAPRFTRVALETDAAVGHVAADYTLDALDDRTLRDAFGSSDADAILRDGDAKGAEFGYSVVSEAELRERAGVPDETVDAVEGVLDASAGEAHLTERAEEGADGATGFDASLVREARNVDGTATDEVLESASLGYVEEDGQVENVAVAFDETDALAEKLAEVLRSKYEVTVKDGTVVLEREVFDAETARELGVPEGPAFGRLSSGESVDIDGRTVTPGEVHETVRNVFEIRS